MVLCMLMFEIIDIDNYRIAGNMPLTALSTLRHGAGIVVVVQFETCNLFRQWPSVWTLLTAEEIMTIMGQRANIPPAAHY